MRDSKHAEVEDVNGRAHIAIPHHTRTSCTFTVSHAVGFTSSTRRPPNRHPGSGRGQQKACKLLVTTGTTLSGVKFTLDHDATPLLELADNLGRGRRRADAKGWIQFRIPVENQRFMCLDRAHSLCQSDNLRLATDPLDQDVYNLALADVSLPLPVSKLARQVELKVHVLVHE